MIVDSYYCGDLASDVAWKYFVVAVVDVAEVVFVVGGVVFDAVEKMKSAADFELLRVIVVVVAADAGGFVAFVVTYVVSSGA